MKKAAYIAWAILILALLCGCRTVKTVETVRDVYKVRTDTVRDSIYRDVFRNVWTSGDTVYDVRTEYVYKDRWRSKTDTVIERDTMNTTSVMTVTTPKTVWERVKTGTWWWLLILAVTEGVVIYFRRN